MLDRGVLAYPAFVRLWQAGTVAWLGSFTFGLALQLLLIETLDADQAAIGFVRSAQWAPAQAVGLLAGVLTGLLTVPVLAGLVAVVGAASIFFHAAHQSYLPALVPMEVLPVANARIEQTTTAAEAIGPLLVGVLVRWLSAPVAGLGVRPPDPRPVRGLAAPVVLRELAVMTVFVFHATVELGLDPVAVGLVLSCAGVSGVVGAGLAPRAAARFGVGRVCVAAMWLHPLAFVFLLLAPPGLPGAVLLGAGQLVNGLGLGLEGPLDLSYRNAVTPDRLRARMNGTIRAVNWGSIAVAAPLAGLAATAYGDRPVIAACIAGLAVAALVLIRSPFRGAAMPAAYR